MSLFSATDGGFTPKTSSVKSGLSIPVSTDIRLLGLEKAPNIIQWVYRREFLNQPWIFDAPKHFETLRDFYELLCPNCNDVDEVRNCDGMTRAEMLSQVLMEYGVCPKCNLSRKTLAKDSLLKFYNEFIGVVGMRGGKTWIAGAYVGTYLAHRMLCMGNIASTYGLPSSQTLEMIFVAASEDQAKGTIWAAFSDAIIESPWFRSLANHLRTRERTEPGLRPGSLYIENTKKISWRPFRLRAVAGHSNSRSLAGPTRVYVAIDELSKFDLSTSKRSADEVYSILAKSLSTVGAIIDKGRKAGNEEAFDYPDPILACVSSPMTKDDKMMRLLKEAQEEEEGGRMFAVHKRTWEFNPLFTRDTPIIQRAYEQDYIKAERDYGARPPDALNPFMDDSDSIDQAIDHGRKPILIVKERLIDIPTVDGVRTYVAPLLVYCLEDKVTPRVIAVDAGKARDALALSISHSDLQPVEAEDGESIERWVTVVDAVVEVRPYAQTSGSLSRHVHFPTVERFIKKLVEKLNIVSVTFDHWNSTSFAQDLEQEGVATYQKNVDRNDYLMLRSGIYSGMVRLLPSEDPRANPAGRGVPQARAIWEIRRLEDSGTRVDHPADADGSKDLADTICRTHCDLNGDFEHLDKKGLAKSRMARMKPFGGAFRFSHGVVPLGAQQSPETSGKISLPPGQAMARALGPRGQRRPTPPGQMRTGKPFRGAVMPSSGGRLGGGWNSLGPNDSYRRSKLMEAKVK